VELDKLKGDPPKINAQVVCRTPSRGPGGEGLGQGQRKGQNRSHSIFLRRGQNSTWQCCCDVGGFSLVDCRHYVRRDMSATIYCVPASSFPCSIHSVVPVSKMFVTVCTVKKVWMGRYVTIIFFISSIRKH